MSILESESNDEHLVVKPKLQGILQCITPSHKKKLSSINLV